MYSFNVTQTHEELFLLKQEWDNLLNHAVFDSFFCCHDWICCWWQSFAQPGDIMVVVTAEKDGELAAIAPLMIRPHKEYGFSLRVLRFIGVPNADRCDFIIAKGHEDVVSELADFLMEKVGGWSQLHLNEIPEESLFANWLKEHKSSVYVEPASECPYVPLANWGTWDDYYKSLSRNTRKLANRKGNRLQKEGLSHYSYEIDLHQDNKRLQAARELERSSEKAQKIEHLALVDRAQWGFQKNLLCHQNSYAVLLVGLEREGSLIAYLYGFIYKGKYYAYNTAYDSNEHNHSPGLLVFKATLQYCKEHDVKEFDFLRGAMQIKKHWAKERRKQNNLYWLKNKPVNWLYILAVFKCRPFVKQYIMPLLQKK